MRKFYLKQILISTLILLSSTFAFAQQVPNAGFEDWSGAQFDGEIQPASWNVSNIEQVGIKFNLTHREAGHSGSYSLMVQDTKAWCRCSNSPAVPKVPVSLPISPCPDVRSY